MQMRLRTILIMAAIFAVLASALSIFILTELRQINVGGAGQSSSAPIQSNVYLNTSSVLPYNDSRDLAIYALIYYHLLNATNATVTLDAYSRNPMPGIYLLNVSAYCTSRFSESALRAGLASQLGSYGVVPPGGGIAFVDIANTSTIPPNSIV